MKRFVVISCDSHAGAPNGVYRAYLDPEFRETFDQSLAAAQELQAAQHADEGRKKFLTEWYGQTHDGGERASWDPDVRDKEMDADGIAAEVVFPDADAANLGWKGAAPFGAGLSSSGASDPRLVMAGARAHNRWLADMCSTNPARRLGVAVVPIVHDIDLGLTEIRRAIESGLRGGVMIPTRWMDKPAYHDPVYDPVWSLCEELDVPVCTHSGAGPADYGLGPGMMSIYVIESWWWAARPLWVLILSGVFERHPRLHYSMAENGAWFVPDILRKMDEKWIGGHATRKMGTDAFRGELSMKPSDYLHRNCYLAASVLGPEEVERRHEIGIHNLLWGSDFPHPEGSWPHTREWLRKRFHDVPLEDVELILGRNALRAFDFDESAVAEIAARVGPTHDEVLG
jgi:predicted TIM-barrel fold metal-dependent hydrolase